jgi:hypothetical protein
MLESNVVEIDGTFLGTVILEDDRKTRRFYATHDSVRVLHNRTLTGLDTLKRQIAQQFRQARAGLQE